MTALEIMARRRLAWLAKDRAEEHLVRWVQQLAKLDYEGAAMWAAFADDYLDAALWVLEASEPWGPCRMDSPSLSLVTPVLPRTVFQITKGTP